MTKRKIKLPPLDFTDPQWQAPDTPLVPEGFDPDVLPAVPDTEWWGPDDDLPPVPPDRTPRR